MTNNLTERLKQLQTKLNLLMAQRDQIENEIDTLQFECQQQELAISEAKINEVREQRKAVARMVLVDGKSIKDVAEELGKNRQTVLSMVQKHCSRTNYDLYVEGASKRPEGWPLEYLRAHAQEFFL